MTDKVSFFPNNALELELEQIPIHVLVAEDDMATRSILTKTLENFGYRVSMASDGEEAWKLLNDQEDYPEMAILDWMMPGLEGIEICQRLKLRENPFVFVIMLTARCTDEDIVKGLESGAHEFLTKPFNINVLKARIAVGARMVRLEKKLQMKNEILEEYLRQEHL